MEQNQKITGFTMSQMIFYYFDTHRTGYHNSNNITSFISENFHLPKYRDNEHLLSKVTSILSTFFNGKKTKQANFFRYKSPFSNRHEFTYEYMPNDKVKIPVAPFETKKSMEQTQVAQEQLTLDYGACDNEESSTLTLESESLDSMHQISSLTLQELIDAIPDNVEVNLKRFDDNSFSITKIHIA